MPKSSLRVLALVTDAFGGHGGIAEYNRHFLSSLAACDRIGEVIVLPRATATCPESLPLGVRQLSPVNGRLAYSVAALRVAQKFRPIDAVFCGHLFMVPVAAVIAKLLQVPLWVQVHGVDAWEELSSLHRWPAETAALITSVSRYTRRRLLEWVAIDPARVKILPNTVDARFQPGLKPAYLLERHGTNGRKVLMTVSRLASVDRYKGHDRVIRTLRRILAEHPETIYLLVGDGDDRPRLEALCTEIGVADKVRFVGWISTEELPDYYRLADVFVMPSTGEGFGIAFLEAMACGIPVIGGNKDGSLDPLGDGTLGTVVDPENEEELSTAISTALRNGVVDGDRVTRFKLDAFAGHLNDLVQSKLICG